jgi:hypothetical protein
MIGPRLAAPGPALNAGGGPIAAMGTMAATFRRNVPFGSK